MDQLFLMLSGVTAVFLSQMGGRSWTRWACLFGLAGQPFWFYALWPNRATQWGMIVLSLLYTLAWTYGLYVHWIRAPRRGEQETYEFAEAIIETLNLPKNAGKGSWDVHSSDFLLFRLGEEVEELGEAMEGDGNPSAEATDVGAFAMMLYHRSLENEEILF